MAFSGAHKFTSSRRHEIQLKRELEAIKNKALVDHYLKQQGGPEQEFQGRGPERGRGGISTTLTPRPPPEPKPEPSFGSKKRASTLQPLPPPTSKKPPSSRTAKPESSRAHRKTTKIPQQPSTLKVVVDSLQSAQKKVAITSSLNTSAPVKYTRREPPKTLIAPLDSEAQRAGKVEDSRAATHTQGRSTEAELRPSSEAAHSKASESSYQRYILSHASYLHVDGSTTPSVLQTPVDQTATSSNGEKKKDGHSDNRSSSSFHSSERSRSGTHSYTDVEGSERFSSARLSSQQAMSELASLSEGGSFPRDRDEPSNTATQVSHLLSGSLRLEIDMRFRSSDLLDHTQSEPHLSASHDVSESGGTGIHMPSRSAISVGSSELNRDVDSEMQGGGDADSVSAISEMQGGGECGDADSVSTISVEEDHREMVGEGERNTDGGRLSDTEQLLHTSSQEISSVEGSLGEGGIQSASGTESGVSEHASYREGSVQSQQQWRSEGSSSTQLKLLTRDSAPGIGTAAQLAEGGSKLEAGADRPEGSRMSLSGSSKPSLMSPTTRSLPSPSELRIGETKQETHSQSHSAIAASSRERRTPTSSSSNLDSGTLRAESSSEKFSTPFSGSLSSFGAPFSFPSRDQSIVYSSEQQLSSASYSTVSSKSTEQSHTPQPRLRLDELSAVSSKANVKIESEVAIDAAGSSYTFASVPVAIGGASIPDFEPEQGGRTPAEVSQRTLSKISGSSLGFDLPSKLELASEIEYAASRVEMQGGLEEHMDEECGGVTLESVAVEDMFTGSGLHAEMASAEETVLVLAESKPVTPPDTSRSAHPSPVPVSKKMSVQGSVETTMAQLLQTERASEIPAQSLAEFLAYTEGPVTLEDLVNIQGRGLGASRPATTGEPGKGVGEGVGSKENIVGDSEGGGTRLPDAARTRKVVFLSTWMRGTGSKVPHPSIHHFCTEPVSPQLPLPLQILSRKTHTTPLPTALQRGREVGVLPPSTSGQPTPSRQKTSPKVPAARPQHRATTESSKDPPATLPASQAVGLQSARVDVTELMVAGTRMEVAKDPSSLLWNPAPPKLSLHPLTIHTHLLPLHLLPLHLPTPSPHTSQDDREQTQLHSKPRLSGPGSLSVPEFSRQRKQGPPKSKSEEPPPPTLPLHAIHEEVEHSGTSSEQSDRKEEETGAHPHISIPPGPHSRQPLARRHSVVLQPAVKHTGVMEERVEDTILRPVHSLSELPPLKSVERKSRRRRGGEDYHSLMEEVERQREQLVAFHKQRHLPSEDDLSLSMEESQFFEESLLATSRRLLRQTLRGSRRKGGATGRTRPLRRTKSALLRAQHARELLSQPPRQLRRCGSFPLFSEELQKITVLEPSRDYRRTRRLSDPKKRDFQALMTAQGASPDADPSQWAYSVWWDRWFPEVLKECREAVAELYSGKELSSITSAEAQALPSKEEKRRKGEERGGEDEGRRDIELENIEPISTSNTALLECLEEEVAQLSREVEVGGEPSMVAIQLCRRGALLRKLGRLKESKEDLDRAIHLEPTLADAYWHRHLLYLLQSNEKAALDDLSTLLRHNKNHCGAFLSRANLLTKQNDLSGAIYNYSQAIALVPDNPQTYCSRAELLEKRGEVALALSDYAAVTKLEPNNTEALSRQAMHKFNQGLWSAASHHFDCLLQCDPNNSSARIHRARAQYNLGRYKEALRDLSASIHLNPNGAEAFYHRACLLRRHHPQQALQDFSTSLLLDDSPANVSAHLHRGVLYSQMKCYNEALSDFTSAIRLNRYLPSAHICAGLVHLLHRQGPGKAVRCFTTAIAVDPTCIQAYLCRAEAYSREEKYEIAILDYTRAIHLEPSNPTLYLYKGELYLRLRQFHLAALHLRVVAKLGSGPDQPRTQGALVESFLGNHNEAVSLLRALPRSPEVCSLVGKVQMRAGQFEGAVSSFRQALTLASKHTTVASSRPSTGVSALSTVTSCSTQDVPRPPLTPGDKAQLRFLCGQGLAQDGVHKEAVEEFTKVLLHDPNHEMAYYERGVSKLKTGNGKGVLDLNRALAINPHLSQAFLTRAAYFGQDGRFSKAILNCNEAIKLVPNSMRAYLYRGSLKYQTKAYISSIEDFTTAIRLDPSHSALPLFNRAISYQATGQLDKALSDYSAVLLLQEIPDVKVLVNRGLLYLELGDAANALMDFLEASKVVEEDPVILQAMGFCYHQLGALESAIEAYTAAISSDPGFLEAYVGRGNMFMEYLTEEGFTNCKEDYQRALELQPGYLPARVNLALLLQAEGRFQQAWSELSAALETDGAYAPALEARAIISLQMNNLFGALLDITAAIKASPSAELYTNRGVIHQFMGDVVSAMRDYQQATRLDPHYHLAHFNTGNILFQQRHFSQAISCYSRALCGSEGDDSVLVNRAIAYTMVGETERAMEDFNTAIEVNPYAAHAYFNRGNLHRSLGHFSSAEEDYSRALELHPSDWLAMYYCGEVLGRQRKTERATELFTMAAHLEV